MAELSGYELITELQLRNLLVLLPDLADSNVMDEAWR